MKRIHLVFQMAEAAATFVPGGLFHYAPFCTVCFLTANLDPGQLL